MRTTVKFKVSAYRKLDLLLPHLLFDCSYNISTKKANKVKRGVSFLFIYFFTFPLEEVEAVVAVVLPCNLVQYNLKEDKKSVKSKNL